MAIRKSASAAARARVCPTQSEPWRHDAAIDRIRARVRFIAAIAALGLMLGCLFASTISVAMHPLITALDQLRTVAH